MPSRADIEPIEMKALLPRLFMVNVAYHPMCFRYRLIGTDIVTLAGRDITGQAVDESTFGEDALVVQSLYGTVVASRHPVAVRGRATWLRGREWMKFESLLLPLSSDEKTVDIILGAFHNRPTRNAKEKTDEGPPLGELSVFVNPRFPG
jgi:hypothetical protein